MSAAVIRSAKLEGSTGTTSTVTITAPAPGNTLLVQVSLPTASVGGIQLSDPLNGDWPAADFFQTGLYGSLNYYYYRYTNIPNAPTSLSVTGTGSFTATFEVIEVSGLGNTSPFVNSFGKTILSGGVSQTTHTATATTTNTSDFVMLGINTSNGRTVSAPSGGYAIAGTDTATPVHLLYMADAGSAGAKATTFTLSANASAYSLGVIYKVAKPVVTSVSSPTATEGAAVTFTTTLASATTATTGYSGVLTSGTADVLVDLTSTLATATYTNGVTFSAGNHSVPTGVSTWDTTLNTLDDAFDEASETFTYNVDGTIGTGTITDDDATPALLIPNPVTVDSGDSVVVTYTLNAASGRTSTYSLVLADGTAVGGTDYDNIISNANLAVTGGSGTVTISGNIITVSAGVSQFTVTIGTAA